MEKILLTLVIVIAGRLSYAQTNIFPSTGNVGIGTTSPSGKLQVQSGSYNVLTAPNTVDIGLYTVSGGWARAFRIVNTSGSDGLDGGAFGVYGSGSTPHYVFMSIPTSASPTGYNSTKILILNNSGNVGIGTTTPDAKLAVNGTIHSKEVKVNLTGWSDYVFKQDYRLLSLTEVKKYIDQNQHLPDMPSEREVIQNGINLGEIVKLQTKKIEELTLYLIEKENELKMQANKLDKQQEQLNQLQKMVENWPGNQIHRSR